MMQDRVGEGLGIWDGQMRPGDVMAVAIAAGVSISIDGTGERCEVPITGPAWVRIGWSMTTANRAAAQGWSLTVGTGLKEQGEGPGWHSEKRYLEGPL